MNYFLSDFEAATAPFASSSHASTSMGPLVLGMNNGDISMESGGEEKDEEEGVVHWQGSQTSSVLDSLLRSGTGKREKATKSRSSAASGMSFSLGLGFYFIYIYVLPFFPFSSFATASGH